MSGTARRHFFSDLKAFITEKSVASTRQPTAAIITTFLAAGNESRRYVWKAKGERPPEENQRRPTHAGGFSAM